MLTAVALAWLGLTWPHFRPALTWASAFMLLVLTALLLEVKQDRTSAVLAMEKLDQPTINLLFDQQRSRRDADSIK